VLAALSSDKALSAGEAAKATGLARPTVSTTLSKLSKTGEVVKADRGYCLPSINGGSKCCRVGHRRRVDLLLAPPTFCRGAPGGAGWHFHTEAPASAALAASVHARAVR
jgi:hypothetical protein